jgi:hypothetical protein
MSDLGKRLNDVLNRVYQTEYFTLDVKADFTKEEIVCNIPVKELPLTRFVTLCRLHKLNFVITLVNKNYVILITEGV